MTYRMSKAAIVITTLVGSLAFADPLVIDDSELDRIHAGRAAFGTATATSTGLRNTSNTSAGATSYTPSRGQVSAQSGYAVATAGGESASTQASSGAGSSSSNDVNINSNNSYRNVSTAGSFSVNISRNR